MELLTEQILKDAIKKHNIKFDEKTILLYHNELISLINYTRFIGQSEGFRDAKELYKK